MADLIAGLDVGWSSSYTALVVARRDLVNPLQPDERKAHFTVGHVSRFPHSDSPRAVVEAIPTLVEELKRRAGPMARERSDRVREAAREAHERADEIRGRGDRQRRYHAKLEAKDLDALAAWEREVRFHLAVDASNDAAFADYLSSEDLGGRVWKVRITSGDKERADRDTSYVPRNRLLFHLKMLSGLGRLRVDPSMDETDALVREIGSLNVQPTSSRNVSVRPKAGGHDDLVMALAMAAWVGGIDGEPGQRVPGPRRGTRLRVDSKTAKRWGTLNN